MNKIGIFEDSQSCLTFSAESNFYWGLLLIDIVHKGSFSFPYFTEYSPYFLDFNVYLMLLFVHKYNIQTLLVSNGIMACASEYVNLLNFVYKSQLSFYLNNLMMKTSSWVVFIKDSVENKNQIVFVCHYLLPKARWHRVMPSLEPTCNSFAFKWCVTSTFITQWKVCELNCYI